MILGSVLVIESLTLALAAANCVFAAGDEKNGHAYFTKAELPDMTKILPPFPAFESARFVADQSQHLWGKLMRLDEERAAQAQRDAVYSMQTIIEHPATRAYRLDGTLASDTSRGVVIKGGQKVMAQ